MFDLVTDESFDLNNTTKYSLSIQVSLDGFSFSVRSAEDSKILAFGISPFALDSEDLIEKLELWFSQHELFAKTYAKVRVILFFSGLTIIPDEFSESTEKNQLTGTIAHSSLTGTICSGKIESIKSEINHYYLNLISSSFSNSHSSVYS